MKNKEVKEKSKFDIKKLFGKAMAAFMLTAMVLGSCAACISQVIAIIK